MWVLVALSLVPLLLTGPAAAFLYIALLKRGHRYLWWIYWVSLIIVTILLGILIAHTFGDFFPGPGCFTVLLTPAAVLLTLVVLTFLIFAPFGRLPLLWRLASRIVLLPLIAGISYEFIQLTARFADHPLVRLIAAPNLALQRLTTREPDDGMLEVAIAALKAVLAGEVATDPSDVPEGAAE